MRLIMIGLACALSACAHSPVDDPDDPLEPVNRVVYGFNEKVDTYVAQPVARGYVKAVPVPIRTGVSNFLDNLGYPAVIINDALQGKFAQAGRDTGRFLLNSTFGLAGLLDPATRVGLEENREDLGQTLGSWGVGPGWYLMLPLLGPTTNRDLVGRGGDTFTNLGTYAENDARIALGVIGAVDLRARLLGAERVLKDQFDPYVFVRSAYLQRRQYLVYDGNPPKEEIDYGDDYE